VSVCVGVVDTVGEEEGDSDSVRVYCDVELTDCVGEARRVKVSDSFDARVMTVLSVN
jgi:hypothetical protein